MFNHLLLLCNSLQSLFCFWFGFMEGDIRAITNNELGIPSFSMKEDCQKNSLSGTLRYPATLSKDLFLY